MELHDLLERLVAVLERLKIPYLITGSVAAMAYGEPRLTNDIDVVIQKGTPFEQSRFKRARLIHHADSYEARFAPPKMSSSRRWSIIAMEGLKSTCAILQAS